MNVIPRLCQIVTSATIGNAQRRILQQALAALPVEVVVDQADLRVQQRQEDDGRDCDRRCDGRGEDRAVQADAAQALVRERGEQDAEHDAGRDREEHEAHGHPETVAELRVTEDVLDLVEPDVLARRVPERDRLPVEGELEVLDERVVDEDAEDDERRREHDRGDTRLACTSPAARAAHRPPNVFGHHRRARPPASARGALVTIRRASRSRSRRGAARPRPR